GTMANPTLTDSFGVSSADFFITPRQDLDNLDQSQLVTITATIPGTNWSRTVDVNIEPTRSDRGSLQITAEPRFIYADNGLTTSLVTAVLKDEDNQSLAGREVIFTATQGAINSPVVTDSLGRAIAVFTDIGLPSVDPITGMPDSAIVTARFVPMGISDFLGIMIGERNPVANISLRSASQQMVAGRGDSTVVRATCFLANDQGAPDGTQVHFDARLGSFTSVIAAVQGGFGAAETYYLAGRLTGTDSLQAWVDNGTERIYSNVVEITLVSGPPNQILLSTSRPQLTTNDPEAFAMITAAVLDTAGNPVRQGYMINFTTSLGTIQPSGVTDENGRAIVRLTPGTVSGTALISATYTPMGGNPISAQITVQFLAGVPNTLELSADPLHIQVAGTGGLTYSTISATVKDANGNNITVPTTVVFELLNEPPEPAGCNFNGRGQRDSSRTANGIAVATLNSGEQIGGKLVRAYTWRDSLRRDTVSTINSNVAVVAGPPFQLDIDVNDDGTDAGGGAWVIEVSARVWDIHRNPVADRIPVVFTVDPEIATIDPGYTGNEGRAGAPVPGLAYADMIYNSVNTFDPIQISAEVQTRQGIIAGTREHILPLQEGSLDLHVDPANWMFQEGSEDAVIRCWVVLKDGHEILINNGPILFTSNRGRFYWFNFRRNRYEMFFPNPARKYTGVVDIENNEMPGQATVFLNVIEPDIFLDPFTLEVTVQINAAVEGYDDVAADPAFIFFTRHGRE
ncbi:MAG: Ig-like domain-containing protein, partial [Calditrichota bacterium]